MKRVATDRSRIETYQRCKRLRWLEYYQDGGGIVGKRMPLPLAVGSSVHVGLATLLRQSMGVPLEELAMLLAEGHAVQDALADFAEYKAALDVGTEVTAATDDAKVEAPIPSAYDEYLYAEQASLVEAMVRAYARRRLRPLLTEFEVLEVEREGEWELASWGNDDNYHDYETKMPTHQLMFLSRPDALLRSRLDGHLEILSFKTTGAWDVRKARDAEHDMQGLSEGIEVERRLGEWWREIHSATWTDVGPIGTDSFTQMTETTASGVAMARYLYGLPTPPRILAIRYEYLLKGERWKDKDLAARFGIDWARAQKSHLVRRYECVSTPSRGANAGAFKLGDSCWSYEYHQEDGRASKLAWQNWDSRLVTESGMTIRQWIDKLDSATLTMAAADSTLGIEPREVGWSCDAQAVGYTSAHPLDAVFLPPMTVYRNDDDLRDLVEQCESQEVEVAEHVAAVEAATDEDERRSLLNRYFPQSRHSCEYPTTCAFTKICYGGSDIRANPLASGLYKIRVPNHPAEAEMREASK